LEAGPRFAECAVNAHLSDGSQKEVKEVRREDLSLDWQIVSEPKRINRNQKGDLIYDAET
jgi:hypothetical protein